jgi:DNA-binding PadR family transcriptional regulator
MFESIGNTEHAAAGDPRTAFHGREGRPGRGRAGHRRGRRMHRYAHLLGHLLHSEKGIDPSNLFGGHTGESPDFTFFDEEGAEMRGDDANRGSDRRHARRWARRGFGWEFGGPRGRGPGQPERPLEQGDLRWLTLDLIAAQPRHGYEIIKAIADALSGHYTPSPGVIYPTLTLLEETGLIAGETQGSKKLYRLTDEGRAEVETHAAEIQAARGRLEAANARFGGSPAPELHRAMNNLRAALQVRLAKGQPSAEALSVITAALDRAAGEIERS